MEVEYFYEKLKEKSIATIVKLNIFIKIILVLEYTKMMLSQVYMNREVL